MNGVFAAQRNSGGVFESLAYTGTPTASIRAHDLADSVAIVGDAVVTAWFGDEVAAITSPEAPDGADIEATAQAINLARIAAPEAVDSSAIGVDVLAKVTASVVVNDAADASAIDGVGLATTAASIAGGEVADHSAIAVFIKPVASINVVESADGVNIAGVGQIWTGRVRQQTKWSNFR